jgi:hypothetical protein
MIGCEEIARKGCEVGHTNRFGPAGGAGDYVKVGYGVARDLTTTPRP